MILKYIQLSLVFTIIFFILIFKQDFVKAAGGWYCVDQDSGACVTGPTSLANCQIGYPACIGPFPSISACTMNCIPF